KSSGSGWDSKNSVYWALDVNLLSLRSFTSSCQKYQRFMACHIKCWTVTSASGFGLGVGPFLIESSLLQPETNRARPNRGYIYFFIASPFRKRFTKIPANNSVE